MVRAIQKHPYPEGEGKQNNGGKNEADIGQHYESEWFRRHSIAFRCYSASQFIRMQTAQWLNVH